MTILSRPDVQTLSRSAQLRFLFRELAGDVSTRHEISALADELRCSRFTIYDWCRKGTVPPSMARAIVLRFGEGKVTEDELTRCI